MRFDKIVAYTYQAETLCPTCVIQKMLASGLASPGAIAMKEEDALDQIADSMCIDRMDESSFDSDEFPKVVFAMQVEGFSDSSSLFRDDLCDSCGRELV